MVEDGEDGMAAATSQRKRRWPALCIALAVLTTSCGGGDADDTVASATSTTQEDSSTSTTLATAPGLVTDVADVDTAVVQVIATGSFVDPEFGLQSDAAGAGTGFLIDPSGLIVTNNHVVTGAAIIKVTVGGEGEEISARVLGVSECSDLAVLDIDGDGYPYLDWYTGEVEPGLDIFAAGFPLGDPEFTLTSGIVSKAEADGDTNWASVPAVIEHDATINPGNSGGPLITEAAEVVGVNYAGSSETNQYFAIGAMEAREVTDLLREGEDENAIGVNGQAVFDEASGEAGVWVAAVESGTPAENAGIEAGDIITKFEGLSVGTDGTMADYCDVLRSHTAEDELSIQVTRFATDEVLTGAINGETLETAFSLGDVIDDSTGEAGGAASYGDYEFVTDDTGVLEVEVPLEWVDVDGASLDFEGVTYPALTVAPSVDDFNSFFDAPGMQMVAFTDIPSTE